MFKTCINVAAVGKAPEIVKKMIDEIGWPIATIIYEQDRVSFYVCYKWYQYYKVCTFKKAVKRCEERNKYYYKPDIYGKSLSQETKFSSEEFKKAYKRFAYEVVRRNPYGRNVETIINENGDTIGYKILMGNSSMILRRN